MDYAARTWNCSLRVIRFWSDNAKCSAQCGRSDNLEDRLTEMSDNRGSTVHTYKIIIEISELLTHRQQGPFFMRTATYIYFDVVNYWYLNYFDFFRFVAHFL